VLGAVLSAQRLESREPQVASREPRAASRKPRAASRKSRAASRKFASRKSRAASREPQVASRKPEAANRKSRAASSRAASRELSRRAVEFFRALEGGEDIGADVPLADVLVEFGLAHDRRRLLAGAAQQQHPP
jgi:hypothetical protein